MRRAFKPVASALAGTVLLAVIVALLIGAVVELAIGATWIFVFSLFNHGA